MKTIFNFGLAFVFVLGLTACNDNDRDDYREITGTSKVKIDSVKLVNDTMSVYSVQSIRTYSTYASGCNGFYAYDYQKNNLNREVTAYQYTMSGPCTQAVHTHMSQFNFQPQETGTYTFKFWNGDNSWITEIIVVQ